MLQHNTDDIRRLINGLTKKEGPSQGLIRGQQVTIYPEIDGRVRILGHLDTGPLSWVGYWFEVEPSIEQLETMMTDAGSYVNKNMVASGTHFYYSGVNSKVNFKLGIETLSMGMTSLVDDFFDGLDKQPVPSWTSRHPKVSVPVTPISVLRDKLSEEGKVTLATVSSMLRRAMSKADNWERVSQGFSCKISHDTGLLSVADYPIYVSLLKRMFKDHADMVVVHTNFVFLIIELNHDC